jgi:hypothetical protein
MENITKNIDFSKYNNVFCDSLEALEWAYKKGLSRDAIVRTSSPAMLWKNKKNIIHIESYWDINRMKEFQTSIKSFSERVYNNVISIESVTHEEALCVAQSAVSFNILLFKAACLVEKDLYEPRLFIGIEGSGGHGGNNMNSPWDKLLVNNSKYKTFLYKLKSDKWGVLTTHGVSLWNRIRIGGVETLIYRLLMKFMGALPSLFFKIQVLVPNENELLIETATSLAFKRAQIRKIKPNIKNTKSISNKKLSSIKDCISSDVNQRIANWAPPSLATKCEEIFFQDIEKKLNDFLKFRSQWQYILRENNYQKKVLLINAAGNIKWFAVTSICREAGIPVVSVQHGVTKEICATHGEVSVKYEINVSDLFIAYNIQSKKTSELSHFSIGESAVVGISARHLRMNTLGFMQKSDAPIAYISTNLYRGNLSNFGTWKTDYDRSLDERDLINNIFGELPHRVLYKTYPEENRRYADLDPVIKTVVSKENIELFDFKVDMRYLLNKHRVLITSLATSTLSWLVMSGKPVVFINRYSDHPLTKEAHSALSSGLFLFDDTDNNFHKELLNFLSLPIEKIEELWESKKENRKYMIDQFFTSSCKKTAGKVAAELLLDKFS